MTRAGTRAAWATVAVVVAVATGSPAAVFAQSASRSPSAERLWQRYPLVEKPRGGDEQGQQPAAVPSAQAAPSLRPAASSPKAPAPSRGGTPWAAVAAGLAALAILFAGGLAVRRLRRRASAGAEASPPGPAGSWRAVIEWADRGGEPRFRAIARAAEGGAEVTVAESRALEFPPTNDGSVRALADEAERLEGRLVAAGWKPVGAGAAWYAKRFAWEPKPSPRRRAARPRKPVAGRLHAWRQAVALWWGGAVVDRADRRRDALAAWWGNAVVDRAGAWRDAVAARWDDAVVDRLAGRRADLGRGHARALHASRILTIAVLIGAVTACIVVVAATLA